MKKNTDEKVQIGPKIPFALKRDLDMYSINTGIDREIIVEMALRQFLQDKDLTPIVQLQLEQASEVMYSDPRFDALKTLIEQAHMTTANAYGRQKLIKRMAAEYRELCHSMGMCVELKMEYDDALSMLESKTEEAQ